MALRLSTDPARNARCALTTLIGRSVLAIALLFSSPALLAETSLEYRVKAAFLYNFTKFVDWPPESYASPDDPLAICVLGTDPFGATLDATVRGKQIGSHPLDIRRISRPSEMSSCKVIYFGPSEDSRLRSHLAALNGQAVLTVSDEPDFLEAGGMIRFLIIDGKVRFDINHQTTDKARLVVSSKLLGVAHAVVTGPGS